MSNHWIYYIIKHFFIILTHKTIHKNKVDLFGYWIYRWYCVNISIFPLKTIFIYVLDIKCRSGTMYHRLVSVVNVFCCPRHFILISELCFNLKGPVAKRSNYLSLRYLSTLDPMWCLSLEPNMLQWVMWCVM